jgi:hypothetical protein
MSEKPKQFTVVYTADQPFTEASFNDFSERWSRERFLHVRAGSPRRLADGKTIEITCDYDPRRSGTRLAKVVTFCMTQLAEKTLKY